MKQPNTPPAYFIPVTQVPAIQPPTVEPPATPPAPPVPVAPPAPRDPTGLPEPAMKRCTNCNVILTSNASFCRKCGVPVETDMDSAPRCPFCGATLSSIAKKCPKCSSEVRCQKCDTLYHANSRFCIKCGESIKGKVEEVGEAPKITCHFCSAPLELDQKICPECGKPVTCPKCGNHLKSGVRFCNKCGENVSEITMSATDEGEDEEEYDEDLESPERLVSCPKCHAKMDENYRYCTICGEELEKE